MQETRTTDQSSSIRAKWRRPRWNWSSRRKKIQKSQTGCNSKEKSRRSSHYNARKRKPRSKPKTWVMNSETQMKLRQENEIPDQKLRWSCNSRRKRKTQMKIKLERATYRARESRMERTYAIILRRRYFWRSSTARFPSPSTLPWSFSFEPEKWKTWNFANVRVRIRGRSYYPEASTCPKLQRGTHLKII